MNQFNGVLRTVACCALGAGALLDIWSLYAWSKRNRLGRGPSGIPGVSLACYFTFCVWRRSLLAMAGLTLFHVACQFAVPWLFIKKTA